MKRNIILVLAEISIVLICLSSGPSSWFIGIPFMCALAGLFRFTKDSEPRCHDLHGGSTEPRRHDDDPTLKLTEEDMRRLVDSVSPPPVLRREDIDD